MTVKIDVEILGFDVVQALQNSELVPGKPTLVRFYLKPADPKKVKGSFLVRGKLAIWLNGANETQIDEAKSEPYPSRGTVEFRGDYTPEIELQREHLGLSLNFEVPGKFRSSEIVFELVELESLGNGTLFTVSSVVQDGKDQKK